MFRKVTERQIPNDDKIKVINICYTSINKSKKNIWLSVDD